MKLTQTDFSPNQYISEEHKKTQIYLHHTAGSPDPFATFKFWETNPEKIATCVVVGGKPNKTNKWEDGEVAQGFSSKFWAYHLGLTESTFHKFKLPYKSLDKISIGIEICNYGQLTLKGGKFYTYVNSVIDPNDVIELSTPHRGFKYYHKYTDKQIDSVRELLLLWKEKYNIPLTYNPDIFDVTPRALKGDSGVFTHNSVRFDKVDVSPQPKLIEMLKSL
jgi:hypothetical protein